MTAALKTTAALLACLLVAHAASSPLTPQKFLEDNKNAFSIIYRATTRVGYLGGFLAGVQGSIDGQRTGATFILPLDTGFVAASNRTVAEMLEEINRSSMSALEYWLGQWIVTQTLPMPDALLEAQNVTTLSGETMTFRLGEDGKGVVVAMEGDLQGAGNILGPAAIPMGQVVTYVLGPLADGSTSSEIFGTFVTP